MKYNKKIAGLYDEMAEGVEEQPYQHSEDQANYIYEKARPLLEFMESYDQNDVLEYGEIKGKSREQIRQAKLNYGAKQFFLGINDNTIT